MHDLADRVQAMRAAFPAYAEILGLAHAYIPDDPAGSLTKSRTVMEQLVFELYVAEMGREPKKDELGALLTDNQFTRRIDRRIRERMDGVRGMGNVGTHGHPVQPGDARRALDDLCEVLSWYRRRLAGPGAEGAAPANDPPPSGHADGGAGGTAVATAPARVELIIDGDLDSFTPERQERVLRAIKELITAAGDIRVISKRRGSVRLTLGLTAAQAEELLRAVKAGRLAHVGVLDARPLAPAGDEGAAEPSGGQGQAAPDFGGVLRLVDALPGDFRQIREGVHGAVQLADTDPETALVRTRKLLELMVRDVYEDCLEEAPGTRPLTTLVYHLVRGGHLPTEFMDQANALSRLGSAASHGPGESASAENVLAALSGLMPIVEWYAGQKRSSPGHQADPPGFPYRHMTSRTEQGVLVLTPTVREVAKEAVGQQLRDEFLAAAAGADRVVVDMRNVAYIGSLGLSALLALRGTVHKRGGRLVLCSVPEPVKEVMRVLRLQQLIEIQPDLAAAVASLAGPG